MAMNILLTTVCGLSVTESSCLSLFVLTPLVQRVILTFNEHCSCTLAHVVRIVADVVASALAQVFRKRVNHGIEPQHSFSLVAERMVSVEQANEIVAQLRELETEQT